MLGNKVYKILKSKKISQLDKIKICLYFTNIKEIFRTYNLELKIKKMDKKHVKKTQHPITLQPRYWENFINLHRELIIIFQQSHDFMVILIFTLLF